MVRDEIEELLRQRLGLDSNSIGSRMIARAVAQRQAACKISDRVSYLKFLRSSPQEFDCLVEAIVVPETWFFRDKEPFVYLRHYLQEWRSSASDLLRILSIPCSTGEEPYSIAMTLLDAGLSPRQFHIDAVDISQVALSKAKQAVYGRKSFRGVESQVIQRYFQKVKEEYEVRSIVRESVHFLHGNALEPQFLARKKYQIIFCRNLLIYLDQSARDRLMQSLDAALLENGILFLGAVETSQLRDKPYTPIDHSFAFAFRKNPPVEQVRSVEKIAVASPKSVPSLPPLPQLPTIRSTPISPLAISPLETAKQLANRGQLRDAAELCKSILRGDPTLTDAYLLLGEVYQGLNQSKQAEQNFQKAIYLNPEAYEALVHLALLKEQQGDRLAAQRLKQRAQRIISNQSRSN